MYERKIPLDMNCPLRLTVSLIGSKWKSCILDELRRAPRRPSELHRLFTELGSSLIPIIDAMIDWGTINSSVFKRK